MNPDLWLGIVAALAAFVLKTTFAFVLCLVFSRLVDSPNRRFMIWLGFLLGSTAYWFWLANSVLPAARLSTSTAEPAASTLGVWQIPGFWAGPLGVALRVAGIAYLLVSSYMLLTYLKKQRRLRWVLGFTSKPPVEIAEVFQPLAESLNVSRSRLLVLSGVTSPATFGWIRPTILLPALCLEQDRSDLEDILRHELYHVRRWDFVWNGFAIVCRALLFFHPAAWYAVRKMQFDRELACDLAVVEHAPARRAMYAECLVRFARLNLSQDPMWGIDFAASSEHLQVRVHSILAGSKEPSGWLLCLRTAFGLVLLAGFLGVAPSLAVLLFYAHRQVPQPLAATGPASRSGIETRVRTSGKLRLPASPTPAFSPSGIADTAVASESQPDSSAGRATGTPASTESGPGPQLLRRPSLASGNSSFSGNNGAKPQSVAFTDTDASGQVSKTGDRDSKQVLQQTATAAAGIYKRLSALDRH